MYHAKKMGRNNFQFFSPKLHAQTMKRIHLESDIRKALDQKEFTLFYQPQVDMDAKVVGMEALIRWQHSKLGMISPRQFIPIAEKTGIIYSISEWVFHTACLKVREWQENLYLTGDATIAINISLRQLKQESFWDMIQKILSVTGLDPHNLEIELTESSIMDDPETTIILLEKMHELGISISVDDFGTGYSSLNYLKRLPIDAIKIDLSFVQGIGKDHNDEEIIKAIITLANSLGLKTIAEGVETNEQVSFLKEYKCDLMQGYYFSRPLPSEDATQFLKDRLSEDRLEESQYSITN
jgi:EAL domain-containing protein (putative c-di-GMP-specific phosphodiesterase class I)